MKNNIMSIVGALVFMVLCSRYKNDPEVLLLIIKYDRQQWNNSGLNPIEYGLILQTKEQEDNFFNQLDLEPIKALQKLRDVSKASQSIEDVS